MDGSGEMYWQNWNERGFDGCFGWCFPVLGIGVRVEPQIEEQYFCRSSLREQGGM